MTNDYEAKPFFIQFTNCVIGALREIGPSARSVDCDYIVVREWYSYHERIIKAGHDTLFVICPSTIRYLEDMLWSSANGDYFTWFQIQKINWQEVIKALPQAEVKTRDEQVGPPSWMVRQKPTYRSFSEAITEQEGMCYGEEDH